MFLLKSVEAIIGKIVGKPIIDKIFPFTEADKAHTYIQDRKNFGKVLLDFREN